MAAAHQRGDQLEERLAVGGVGGGAATVVHPALRVHHRDVDLRAADVHRQHRRVEGIHRPHANRVACRASEGSATLEPVDRGRTTSA
jgi:hypothetical protein